MIDYTQEDFTAEAPDGSYDVIFDAVGKMPKQGKNLLKKSGIFLNVLKSSGSLKTEDLEFLKELVKSDKIKPVIDRVYPLEQIVEAHRYVEKGHKKGNVVIAVDH